MDRKEIEELEHMLFDKDAEAKALPLSLLKHITNDFSDEERIGHGGFAVVYKGMLENGAVAVKKLLRTLDIDEKLFSKEVHCLMKAKHTNIVRFLGYCSDTQGEMVDYEGELVLADVRERLLCFEYLSQGSLDKQITDASCGLEWKMRYQIIYGICEGLYYLHQKHILHLDLKPANILLDDNMIPKIADFGISRFLDENQDGVTTSSMIGTVGYLAPEFYGGKKITFKLDIYSLGIIIIDILTGEKGHPDIDSVLERWRCRLEKTRGDAHLVQVRVCTEIAIQCTDSDPVKRPDTRYIIDRLGATRCADESDTKTEPCSSSALSKAAVPSSPTIGLESTMAIVVKKSTEELYKITNQNLRFSSMPDNSSNVQQVTDIRETASDVEEALIIGRTEEKQKILATFSGTVTQEITILPIYGIGGIGKTTLAQLVFNDPQFSCYSRVWVYVSQNIDLNKIGNSIISQLSEESSVAEKQIIHNRLRKLLAGKKILIVLDDVWEKNPNTLKTLKAMLRLGAGNMVKIIVTTRDEAIAREICHTVEPYKLDTFSDEICWKIIKQKTSFKDRVDKKQLKHIGREIATKCGGVALAAQSLGYTLNNKNSDEWESVRDNYIWNLSTSEDPSSTDHEVLASLLLSYTHLSECLKLCFSYCAVFPKGHIIVKYDLIHQWIALGFMEPSKIFDSMQLCEKYVTQLLGMSFLQYSRTSLNDGVEDKDDALFMMHDLVHDLATAILADQVYVKGKAGGNRCRYVLRKNCFWPLQKIVSFPANIKALHFLGGSDYILRGPAFSPAECLLVLDLSGCCIEMLPDSIGELKQLRFLHAPRTGGRTITSRITELSELNYLNLRGSSCISALPESIGDMKGLMHLDLSGCDNICQLPKSFQELKQLVHLDLSCCCVPISEALGGFTKLQYLNLSFRYGPTPNRIGLTEVMGNLIKLRYLNLSGCLGVMVQSQAQFGSLLESISTLHNLEHLDLSHNRKLSRIPESIGNLMKLHTLNLLECYELKKLPDSMVNMVSLKVLTVEKSVTLDESVLSLLNIASLPHFVVHASSHKCNSNIIRLQRTNPVELMIDRLENVKSVEEAQSIKLVDKRKLKKLSFEWTVDAGRFVDDKKVLETLVPPSSVGTLYIKGYMSASLPDWLMDITHYLPNLWEISLWDFPNCTNLPPLGQLPNLQCLSLCRMDGLKEWNMTYTSGEERENKLLFRKLEMLSIEHCAKLRNMTYSNGVEELKTAYTSDDEGATELMLPKLNSLSIKHCEKLRIKPCLPGAITLCIVNSDNILSSSWESLSLSGASFSYPTTYLNVSDIKLPLHQWKLLHQLHVVRSITINRCSDLTTSPESDIIEHLSSLKTLELKHHDQEELPSWLVDLTSLSELSLSLCGNLTSLPQRLGELTSLTRLEISDCKEIRSLPESIQQLTKLHHLRIRDCPALKEWWESEDNKRKLAHIRRKWIS